MNPTNLTFLGSVQPPPIVVRDTSLVLLGRRLLSFPGELYTCADQALDIQKIRQVLVQKPFLDCISDRSHTQVTPTMLVLTPHFSQLHVSCSNPAVDEPPRSILISSFW